MLREVVRDAILRRLDDDVDGAALAVIAPTALTSAVPELRRVAYQALIEAGVLELERDIEGIYASFH